MSLYKKYFLPWFLDKGMQNKAVQEERQMHIAPFALGVVLDVGAGSATNIPFFGDKVEKVIALEPFRELWLRGSERVAQATFPVEYVHASAESIPLPDESVDTVVSAFSLCSIPNVSKALKEMRRVLKPGGTYVFLDHGVAPDTLWRRLQQVLGPVLKPLAGGCNLDRRIDSLIKDAGFTITHMTGGYEPYHHLIYLYKGRAIK
jgi:ubiquinone/menaquinone biosynthesis C-methylase UbiE